MMPSDVRFCAFYDSFCMISRPPSAFTGGIVMRKQLSSFAIVAALFVAPLFVNAQTAPNKVPLTHEAMWMMKRVGAPVPSPDGKWVVFSLVEPAYDEKDQVSDL